MSMTKKEGRGYSPLPLREQAMGAKKLMCSSLGSENIRDCSLGGGLDFFGGLRQRSGLSGNIPACNLLMSKGLGWYSSKKILPVRSALAISILSPFSFTTNYPVSQGHNEVMPVTTYEIMKCEAGCLDKGLRLGVRKTKAFLWILLEALGWQVRAIRCYLSSKLWRGVGLKLRRRLASFSSHRPDVVRQVSEMVVAVFCKEIRLWVVNGLTCLSFGERTFKRFSFEVSGGVIVPGRVYSLE